MSEKRRDTKNRVLRTGESQQKNGRYVYKYIEGGRPRFAYSWKLVATDRTPKGKRDCLSLREKEKEIRRDLDDGINHLGSRMSVCQLYEKHTSLHSNVKEGTKRGRAQLMRLLREDAIGSMAIGDVKPSDGMAWALRMQSRGYAYKTIANHKRSLKAAFYTAISDDFIRKNPFDFDVSEVLDDDTEPKEALSPAQQAALLDFMRSSKVYQRHVDEVIILLGTGIRISELCGLTEADIELNSGKISITHQLLRNGGSYSTPAPKTASGVRQIPMTKEVREAFVRVLENRRQSMLPPSNEHKRFLFLTQRGTPKTAGGYAAMFRGLVKSYEKSGGIELPRAVTAHTMRHTFCTNLANAGMNPKALQYLMGHSSITMTLNYYTHANFESAEAEMRRLTV